MATKIRRDASTVLKQLRAERGLTQEDLEAQTGISQTLISQMENGHRSMTYATAVRLELALGLPRGELDDVAGDLPSPAEGMRPYRSSRRASYHARAVNRVDAGASSEPADVAAVA